MSTASDANDTDGQFNHFPRSKLLDHDVESANHSTRPERVCPNCHEYTTLLKKHLGVVESELNKLKGSQNTEPGRLNTETGGLTSQTSVKYPRAQEARIYRVPPWEWREVKKTRAIDPNLPTLIVSSKGHGGVGRRSTGRSSTKHGQSHSGGISKTEEPFFDTAYRIAINSRTLLNVLGVCTGMEFPEDRNVWLRPFKYLVAYETEIKQALRDAELKVDQLKVRQLSSDPAASVKTHNGVSIPAATPVHEEEVDASSAIDIFQSKAERDQLRCLVDFMTSDMQDIFDIKRQVANRTLEEVAFEHLWLLYAPGDLVFTNETLEGLGTYQAYRVLHVTGGRAVLDTINGARFNPVDDRDWDMESESEEQARDTVRGLSSSVTPFIIDCFSIDFDGNRMGPNSKRFVIPTFPGKRKVDALGIKPSFCLPQHDEIRGELVERGRKFTLLANGTHKKYSGMTLRESKELWESGMNYWNYIIHAEEVDSEVMLDQSAGVGHFRKTHEGYRLKIGGRTIGVPTAADRREMFDPLPVKRDEQMFSDVYDDSIIDLDRRKEFVNSTTLLGFHQIISDPSLSDDYVMLLPVRVYGYAMRNRKWFPLNINLINDITPGQAHITAARYEDLVLPDGHKKLLQAIVKNQVRDPKQTRGGRKGYLDEFQMDVVKDKGKGLIILLHGAPGVGKTSTAECVAAQLRRPLLPITCGDISTKVEKAEATLQEFCRLADRWRCVLLLDEADVFLAKREKGDITRNGLVSVFLRVLEYFSGVIILTTNRVGEFDEAFRSRIHVSLYYPKLDRDTTLQIWERSLQRLRKSGLELDFSEDEIREFAEHHWLDNVKKQSRHWNGRQIKNGFQTALALANWEYYETKQGQTLERPLLKAQHFKAVARTSAHFDDYISNLHKIPDDTYGVLAARDQTRDDTHPSMSLGQSDTQDFVSRSRRAVPSRRGAGFRDTRLEEDRPMEGGSESARVRELEIQLEILRLKQASGKGEMQAQAGHRKKEEDEHEEEW